MFILGIETSCDETAAAIVRDGVEIVSNVVASSQELHTKTGGIIPEQAAREQIKCILPVIEEAIRDVPIATIDAIAVTYGPGLIGSLLVGIETAKTLADVWKKSIVPVNHLVGHIYANFIEKVQSAKCKVPARHASQGEAGRQSQVKSLELNKNKIEFPAMVLIVSGGHTELVLMKNHGLFQFIGGTRDDAAGEAFDKVARLLGLPYPGGPSIEKAALKYSSRERSESRSLNENSSRLRSNNKLPRPMINSGDFDFSFSGLKTAVLRYVQNVGAIHELPLQEKENIILRLAYETQEAITDVLVKKTTKAAEEFKVKSILLAGGVTANLRLREKITEVVLNFNQNHSSFWGGAKATTPESRFWTNQDKDSGQARMTKKKDKIILSIPPVSLCTDNAAYIASAAFFNYHPVPFSKIMADPGLEIT